MFSQIKRRVTYWILSNLYKNSQIKQDLDVIKRLVKKMATKQEEFDAQLAGITAQLDEQDATLIALRDTVVAEAEEVRVVIEELRAMIDEGTVDFSALTDVANRLDTHESNLELMVQSVDEIYEEEDEPEEPVDTV